MTLIRDSNQLPACVATIGNFDGVHLGHQQLLSRLKMLGQQYQVPTVVITFEPQPQEFFVKSKAPSRLMRFRQKYQALKKNGIDYVVCLRFNHDLAALSPDEFVQRILMAQLGVKAVIVGDDFRFGAKRVGDYHTLQQLGKKYGFVAEQVPAVLHHGERISSTRIRQALQAGNLALAQQLLGRHYCLAGHVAHGDQRGREWGIPTANIHLPAKLGPLSGIFVVRATVKEKTYAAVANVGTRPMFQVPTALLEVHLFDFDQDIYGCQLCVEFLHKLRDEQQFDSVDALIEQMYQDIAAAKRYGESADNPV